MATLPPMPDHPLDRPIWSALTTDQARIAEVSGIARRFPAAVTTLSAFPELADLRASSLGEHNREVVCGLLGWSEERYQGLVDRGILRHEPIS